MMHSTNINLGFLINKRMKLKIYRNRDGFPKPKANLERDIAREIQNRESNLINYTNQRALEREPDTRLQFDIDEQ